MSGKNKLTILEYMQQAKRTMPSLGEFEDQLHMVLGASTEAGELLDIYKKKFAYGKKIDYVNLEEEIFDIFWYLVNLCTLLDIDPERGMYNNIEKLKLRFPNKFNSENAIDRDADKEHELLEKLSQNKE